MKIIKRGGTEDRGTRRGGGGSLTGKTGVTLFAGVFLQTSPAAEGASACG